MSKGRRLFVVDPSLKDIRGHHYALANAVTDSAVLAGLTVIWLASREASKDLRSNARLVPTFGQDMYSSYQKPDKPVELGFRRSLSDLTHRIFKPSSEAEATVRSGDTELDIKTSMLESLLRAFEKLEVGPADRVLFHTADGATYDALSEIVGIFPAIDLPLIHICTPYDPVGVMPNRESPEIVKRAIENFEARNLLGRRIFLHAENPLLAEHLSRIWECRVTALDLPVIPITESMKTLARAYRRDRLATKDQQFLVVSLGAARLEKGFHLIPDVIRRTFEFAGAGDFSEIPPGKVKFALHASAQIIGRHPVIEKAIDRLRGFSSEQVVLLTDSLTDVEYRNLTLASDAVLMPYDEAAYKVRGSGVVAEAVVAQKFIIAKSGSYPAEMATWQGGAVGETPADIARALLTVVKNRWQQFELLKKASDNYSATNSVEQYVQKMIRSERRGNAN